MYTRSYFLVQVLGQKDFLELANHVLKGDQLIVRGCDVTTVTSIISILKVSTTTNMHTQYNIITLFFIYSFRTLYRSVAVVS